MSVIWIVKRCSFATIKLNVLHQNFRDGAQVLISTEVGGKGRNLQYCNAIVNL
ncbi:hypothetical protein [Clostridium coskatii]|uniref:hypothetical protein n=1 Tax=Clostridium coskatii TaxID=1705578 RepID=UPI000B0C7BC1|nr:hypothetical protein [Clostridium coskatii]